MTATGGSVLGGATSVRAEPERDRDGLLAELRRDPATGVLVVRGDRADLADGLRLVAPDEAPADAQWAFLGRDGRGRALVAAVLPDDGDEGVATTAWSPLRTAAATLPDGDAALLRTAVALGRWLVGAPFCPACGTRMTVRAGGWARTCPSCGRDEFPRTDPAVIATIASAADPDLLLLGSHAAWGIDRYSCFAGFVEAGESLEDTVVRELREEAGVTVEDLRYAGSQPWPYPRSLMVGFHTRAAADAVARPDGDEIVQVRWFGRDEIAAALRGEGDILLPGPSAIAHRLIAEWCEGVA